MQKIGRDLDPALVSGTPEHAASLTEGRWPQVHDALQWLTCSHLPEKLRQYSHHFYFAAAELLDNISTDSQELVVSLNKLIEAKDAAVRAGIKHQTGRAGSIPRPAEVVNPPVLNEE